MSISNLSHFPSETDFDVKLDTCGLICPLPLLRTKQALYSLAPGQVLWVLSEEPSLQLDIKSLVRQTQDELLHLYEQGSVFHFLILKK